MEFNFRKYSWAFQWLENHLCLSVKVLDSYLSLGAYIPISFPYMAA